MATFKHLTEDQIAEVAAKYGLSASDRDVLECAQQADEAHGKPARHYADPGPHVGWATDPLGYFYAPAHFDGLVSQIEYERNCEGREAHDFYRNAYGEG